MGSEKWKPGREGARWGDLSDDDDGEEQLHRPLPPRIGGDLTDLSLPLRALVASDDGGEEKLHRPLLPRFGGDLTDLSLPLRALVAPDDDGEEQLHRPLPPRIGGDLTDLSLPLRALVAPDGKGHLLHHPLPPRVGDLTDRSLPRRVLVAPDDKGHLLDCPLPPLVGDLTDRYRPLRVLLASGDKDHLLDRPLPPRVGDLADRSLLPRVIATPGDKGHLLDRALPPRVGDLADRSLLPRVPVAPDGNHRPLPPPVFTGPDENGIKTRVDYRINKYGNMVEVTTRTRRVRKQLPGRAAAILERRSWLKFGDAVEDGSASPVTEVSRDSIYLEQRSAEPVARAVGAYVPPRRFAAEMPRRGAKVALTLSNLRLDADETDLKNLCVCFGPLRSVSIARDSKTGRSKGAGVVSFFKTADAEAALATLQGYAYGHLILEVGWAA
ncbi:hypothetical protein ACQ4PT_003068 [Festuca glaucescens]